MKTEQLGLIEQADIRAGAAGIVYLYSKPDGTVWSVNSAGIRTQLGISPEVAAYALRTTGDAVYLADAPPPVTGQTLVAISPTEARWQTQVVRTVSVTSIASLIPEVDIADCIDLTAQAVDLDIAAPSGTPINFQKLIIRIRAVAECAISFDAVYEGKIRVLPETILDAQQMYLGFIYDSVAEVWDLVAYVAV